MNISLDNTSLASLWGNNLKPQNISTGSGSAGKTESANSNKSTSSSSQDNVRTLKRVNENDTTLENRDGDTAEISNYAMQANGIPSEKLSSESDKLESATTTTGTTDQSVTELSNKDGDTVQISSSGMKAANSMPAGPPPSENSSSGESGSTTSTTETSSQSASQQLLSSDDDDDDDEVTDNSLQALLERASNGTATATDLQKLAAKLREQEMLEGDSAKQASTDYTDKEN